MPIQQNIFHLAVLALLLASMAISAQAATITVNSLSDTVLDDGVCTLREAITSANTDSASGVTDGECKDGSGDDLIEFSVAGTIQPTGEMPAITTVVHINGYSAPGASVNTLPLDQGTDAVLTIELDGANAGNFPGLAMLNNGASGSIIEGLIINNSANAQCCNTTGLFMVGVAGARPTWIRGNFIQVNADGSAARPKGSRGIWANGADIIIGNESTGALVPAYTNLISGGGNDGVLVTGADSTVVRGNLIGTNRSGTAGVGNFNGIVIDGSSSKIEIVDNVVSGNNQIGLYLRSNISEVIVARNLMGTNATGDAAIPNNSGGIRLQENRFLSNATTRDIDIFENLVAYNNCPNCSGGIVVGLSTNVNFIDAVRIQRNSIFSNAGLEIDLAETNATNDNIDFGVTLNDTDDPDPGPNRLQNFPELTKSELNGLILTGKVILDSEPSKTYTIDFYETSSCDTSGYGGGEAWLASADINTDVDGDAGDDFQVTLSSDFTFITATATHLDHGTSEFSRCLFSGDEDVFDDGFETLAP